MMRPTRWVSLCAFAILMARPTPGVAQATADGLQTGPISWKPVISLRDVGLDSNVFDDPARPREDRVGTFSGRVDATLPAPYFRLSVSGGADALYFERYEGERSINRRASLRIDLPLARVTPFVSGGYERARERQGFEVDLRSKRRGLTGSVGLSWAVTPRGSLQASVGDEKIDYDAGQTFRGLELSRSLNHEAQNVRVGARYEVTPLTILTIDGMASRDRFADPDRNLRDTRATIGLSFSPDAVISGRATVAYHKLDTGPAQVPFEGYASDVDLSFSLFGTTRVQVRYNRDTNISLEQPYFLQQGYGVDIQQRVLGPVQLLANAQLQTLDYPGVPSRNQAKRRDDNEVVGGGVGVQASRTTRITATYEWAHRRSSITAFAYTRRRVLASLILTLG